MANLSTVQDHLEALKTGTPELKKQKLTPESIADVRKFIAEERANRTQGTHYSLEWQFHEWEDLVTRFTQAKTEVTTATAGATANIAQAAGGNTMNSKPIDLKGDEIKEALSEINPVNLEKAISISESVINMLAEPMKSTMRWVHGAIIFDILRNAGHNLALKNGQIEIIPKPGTNVVNLQEKLQTLVNTGKLSLDSLKLWMLYSSPSFKEYANLKKTADGKIDPKASTQDFMQYLKDLEKAGNKSGDIQTILQSGNILNGVNMPQAIKGFQDLGQVGTWLEKNQAVVTKVAQVTENVSQQTPTGAKTASNVPTEPNNTLTGKLGAEGKTGGHFTWVAGDAGKWLLHGVSDLFSLGKWDPLATLGIWAALIYGIYKGFQKFGFLGWIAALFWIGALNNIEKIMWRAWVDSWDIAEKAKKLAQETAAKAKAEAEKLTGGGTKNEKKDEEKKWGETTGLTEAQKYFRNSITADKALVERVNKAADIKWNVSTAKFDDYINYIEKDIADTPLSKIFPIDHTKSIFHDSVNTELSPDSKMGTKMLKRVMRAYLVGTGYDTLSGTGDTGWKTEKETFLKNMEITEDDIKNKKLSDVLVRIQSKRSGGIKPTEAQKEDAKTNSNKPAETIKSHKIGNVDVEVGKNVQLDVLTVPRGADRELLSTSKLKKEKVEGIENFVLPKGSVVTLGDSVLEISSLNYVKVKYAWEEFYVYLNSLKPIPTK